MTDSISLEKDVCALIASRICHDLVNPMGAVMNGVELLAMELDDDSPELDLLKESGGATVSLIKRFRVMFGQASRDSDVAPHDLSDIIAGFDTPRMQLKLLQVDAIDRVFAKAFCLALNCVTDQIPMGGEVEISVKSDVIRIRAHSDRIKHSELMPALSGEKRIATDPARVHFALLQALRTDKFVDYEINSDEFSVTVHLRNVP